jgi:hypothetical protein
MRVGPWEHMLSAGGSRSFGALFPEESRAILHAIEHGASVDFIGDRETARFGRNHGSLEDHVVQVRAIIRADAAALKKAGPYASPLPVNGRAANVSPLGAVQKRGSTKVRVIHDLSFPRGGDSINAGIADVYLPLASFGLAARAVRALGPGCLLIKLDVEAAYKQVPVRPEDWHLLGFMFEGKFYYERALPFGLRSSCRLWDMFAAALHFFCEHALGVSAPHFVVHYVDDFLFVIDSADEAQARFMLEGALALCKFLGVPMSEAKTEGPVTCLVFLGITLDTVRMEARLDDSRLAELRSLCLAWQSKGTASAVELQSLAGKLNFACSVVRPGRIFIRHILQQIRAISAMRSSRDGRPLPRLAQVRVPQGVREDVTWWVQFLPQWNGSSLLYDLEWADAPSISLQTDACQTGYGGHYEGRWFAGRWSPAVLAIAHTETTLSMPFLELLALVIAAGTFGHLWQRKKITFQCDCLPVVHAVSGQGSRNPRQMHLLRALTAIACLSGFDFRAVHIAGVTNTVADCLSRDGDCPQFRVLCPSAERLPTEEVWPDLRTLPPQQAFSLRPPSPC